MPIRSTRRRVELLTRFARSNGFEYEHGDRSTDYPGTLFQRGTDRVVIDRLRRRGGRLFEAGNYAYEPGNTHGVFTQRWGYLVVQLDRGMPHLFLNSRPNRLLGAGGVPRGLAGAQILQLEGEFDRHFTLYCPQGYERDALYVLSPDLMALLIDHAAPYDIEIVDDLLFVYSPDPFDLTSERDWRRIRELLDAILGKSIRQTARYTDARADPARRLRRSGLGPRLASVSGAIAFLAVAAYWLARTLT
ncbi:hypothetical protein [Herbiconiux sp. YIM B11900]|uniref:hypothetical protein n=1 Tax=Herbiconiux sp. YIM B11900 TaxID=3404131 RepID=UPI003F84CCCA